MDTLTITLISSTAILGLIALALATVVLRPDVPPGRPPRGGVRRNNRVVPGPVTMKLGGT